MLQDCMAFPCACLAVYRSGDVRSSNTKTQLDVARFVATGSGRRHKVGNGAGGREGGEGGEGGDESRCKSNTANICFTLCVRYVIGPGVTNPERLRCNQP